MGMYLNYSQTAYGSFQKSGALIHFSKPDTHQKDPLIHRNCHIYSGYVRAALNVTQMDVAHEELPEPPQFATWTATVQQESCRGPIRKIELLQITTLTKTNTLESRKRCAIYVSYIHCNTGLVPHLENND